MPKLATATSTFVRMANRPLGLQFFQLRRRTTMRRLEFPSAMREARKDCFETKPLWRWLQRRLPIVSHPGWNNYEETRALLRRGAGVLPDCLRSARAQFG